VNTNKTINSQTTSEKTQSTQLTSLPLVVRRNYWKVGFFILLILWFLTVVGLAYSLKEGSLKTQKTTDSSSSTAQFVSSGKDSEVPPSWKVYENKDYHFTVSHPGSWTVEEDLIQEMKVATRFGCIAGFVGLINKEKNLKAYIYYRYPGICTNVGMRTGVGYNQISDEKILNIKDVEIPYVYLGDGSQENPVVKEVFYNGSAFTKIGDLEFLFGTVNIDFDKNFAIDEKLVKEINSIFATLEVPAVSGSLEIESIIGTAHEYSQAIALVNAEVSPPLEEDKKAELWRKIEELCGDANFNKDIIDSYKITQIDMVDSKPDEKPEYYRVFVNIFTKTDGNLGKWQEHKNKEILMVKKDGIWKALTWYFFE